MSKYLLIIDIDDDLVEYYKNFYVTLRAERKNTKGVESVNYVENCKLKPLGRKVEEYGLETWNTRDGIFLCEKGLFDKLYGEDDEID